MRITIRTATAADSELIRELGVRIFTDAFGPANTPENMRAYLDAAFSAEAVRAEVADPASTHLIAEADGTAVGYARDAGHDIMYLGVWEHNPRAVAFYRKWGFERFGEHIFMLGDDEQTDWLMRRG